MFYLNNIAQEVYRELRDKNLSQITNLSNVEICNNTDFVLDLTGVKINNESSIDEILLIMIQWGDGTSDRLSRPMTKTDVEWKMATHFFNTNNQKNLKITIKVYNIKGELVEIQIPYTILNKSIYDLGAKFKLLQANVSNKNLTQFILKEGINDSIIIVSEKGWKEL